MSTSEPKSGDDQPSLGAVEAQVLADLTRDPGEAHIVINGRTLTPGEAMTLRVAISSFHGEMGRMNALGDDNHGRSMTAGYRRDAETILQHLGVIHAPDGAGPGRRGGPG